MGHTISPSSPFLLMTVFRVGFWAKVTGQSSSPRATALKQTMQNTVKATHQESIMSRYYLLTTQIKVCEPIMKPSFDLCQAFNWSKNNFSQIHIFQGLNWAFRAFRAFPSLCHY